MISRLRDFAVAVKADKISTREEALPQNLFSRLSLRQIFYAKNFSSPIQIFFIRRSLKCRVGFAIYVTPFTVSISCKEFVFTSGRNNIFYSKKF
jgi:hypothetical protein